MIEVPVPKPWMIYNNRGWLLCLMCPMAKDNYYRGIKTNGKRTTRKQISRWVRRHRRCGFLGLS